MKRLLLILLAFPTVVWGQDVARLFGKPVGGAEIKLEGPSSTPGAARNLRELAAKETLARFVAANRLQATKEEVAAYRAWEVEFRKKDEAKRAERLLQLEAELKDPALEAKKRESLLQQRDVLLSLRKHDAERGALVAAGSERVHATWIEGYKLKKALYEKYGGRVGIGKWGPEPVGAMEALLREHEKRGELVILDAALEQEFWGALAKEPRFPAQPADIDFTYYWLKPPR